MVPFFDDAAQISENEPDATIVIPGSGRVKISSPECIDIITETVQLICCIVNAGKDIHGKMGSGFPFDADP